MRTNPMFFPVASVSHAHLITVQQAADILKCHHTAIRRLGRDGLLHMVRLRADRMTLYVDRREVKRVEQVLASSPSPSKDRDPDQGPFTNLTKLVKFAAYMAEHHPDKTDAELMSRVADFCGEGVDEAMDVFLGGPSLRTLFLKEVRAHQDQNTILRRLLED